jgi:hypothetical protein
MGENKMESVVVEVEMPDGWETFRLPAGVNRRLQELLDKQDSGSALSPAEREEAQGLVDLSEWLSLLRTRAQRLTGNGLLQP